MTEALTSFLAASAQRIEAALDRLVRHDTSPYADMQTTPLTARLVDAMRYAVLGGGKRLRAALVLASHDALGRDTASPRALDQLAASIECLHAYSLVHDDLPAMDDDALRRGKPSCHVAYDEATAILAGDALQSLGFELLASCPDLDDARRARACLLTARAIGATGMAGGQAIDLAAERQRPSAEELETMHRLKTGALFRAAVGIGAIAAGATDDESACLDRYAAALGLAFQIRDDVLDVAGSTATLGKIAGADAAHNKATYVALLGVEEAERQLQHQLQIAFEAISGFGVRAETLRALAEYAGSRQH